MSTRRLAGSGLLLLWLAFAGIGVMSRQASASGSSSSGPVVVSAHLDGVVDPFTASAIDRAIAKANHDHDGAVLLTIDTPGGLDTSMRDIVRSILASRVPVICWTGPSGARAASAGTFVMLACPINAMAPGTEIGAAHPVGVSGAIESEKVTNDAAAFIQSLARRWGRNAPWAVSAVRQAASASAEDAVGLHVVDGLAKTPAALLNEIGCVTAAAPPLANAPAARSRIEAAALARLHRIPAMCDPTLEPFHMSIGESLFHSIADPNVAFLLINIGFLALIVWVFHPGLHVSLGVGVVCMAIGLAILETLPVQLVGFVLLAVAGVLFVLDVKAKAHGVLTAGGIGTLVLGGLLLFDPSVPSAHVSRPLIAGVAIAIAAFTSFALRALFASREAPVRTGREALEGSWGVATTALAPRGMVRARGETWSAEALDRAIAPGESVRVVRVRGVTLLVEPAQAVPVGAAPAGSKEGERP